MIAALYIDATGPYPRIQAPPVDCWDAERDARKYAGPHAVVAHPPCGPWGKLAHMCKHQDPALAIRAVAQVRAFGGALEHPAQSRLWGACALPEPGEPDDVYGGYTIEVNQCEWGHVTRKPTRLYLVRVPRGAIERPPFPGREPTHSICNGRGQVLQDGSRRKRATAAQAIHTPPAFAEYLVRLARSVRP